MKHLIAIGTLAAAVALTAIDMGAAAGAAPRVQAQTQEQAQTNPVRVPIVISVAQSTQATGDAQKQLQATIKRIAAAIGFVSDSPHAADKSKVASRRAPRTSSAAATEAMPAAPADPAGVRTAAGAATHAVAGTVSSELFDILAVDAEIPTELATERVRDQLLALKVADLGATLDSVAGRAVTPPVALNIESKHTSDRAVEALELDIRDSMAKWGIVLFGTKSSQGSNAIQLSLLIDANECSTLPARLRRGFASRITRASCS